MFTFSRNKTFGPKCHEVCRKSCFIPAEVARKLLKYKQVISFLLGEEHVKEDSFVLKRCIEEKFDSVFGPVGVVVVKESARQVAKLLGLKNDQDYTDGGWRKMNFLTKCNVLLN